MAEIWGLAGCGHGVLYGRPSARAKMGIQKPVHILVFSALPESEGWFERGWCIIWGVVVEMVGLAGGCCLRGASGEAKNRAE